MVALLSRLIDDELNKDAPFNFKDYELPSVKEGSLDFADEGGHLLMYMGKLRKPQSLDTFCNLRHDVGIPDLETFLYTFAECLSHKVIRQVKSKNRYIEKPLYEITPEEGHETVKKKRNKSSRYERFLKLKKEFESEE